MPPRESRTSRPRTDRPTVAELARSRAVRTVRTSRGEFTLDAMGHVTAARLRGPGRAGLSMKVRQKVRGDVNYAETTYRKGKASLCKIKAAVSRESKWVSFDASGKGLNLEWRIDFPKGATKPGVVKGKANGHRFEGVYVPATNKSTVDLGLDSWLPEDLANKLQPFTTVANRMISSGRKRNRELHVLINRPLPPDAKGGINWWKAACWGFGGLGAAASCIGTAGLGCVLAGGAFAAAASICCQSQ